MELDCMRKISAIVLLLLATVIVAAQKSIPGRQGSEIDVEHTKWIDNVMSSILTIKPGATRKDLLKVFTTEGGLSTRTQRTYVYRRCPYIKVDVKFAPVGDEDNGFTEMPEDKVVEISRPYLQYTAAD
jgi:hypothetical protein